MRRLPTPLAGLVSLLLLAAGAAAQSPADEVVYSTAADSLVIEFREQPGELRSPGPSLRVYGDGRFVVQRPTGMKRAGEFSARLTREELAGLLERLAGDGVLDFDAEAARRARADAAAGRISEASDPDSIFLVVRAARVPAGAARSAAPAEKRITWRGLRGDVRAHPEILALQGLADACAELRALVDARDLEPLR